MLLSFEHAFFSDVMVVLSVWQNNAQPFVCFWFLVPPCQTKGKTHKTQTCFELNIVFVWHCATHLQNNSNTLVKVKQMRRPMQIAPWMQELFHEVFHMIPNTKKKNVLFNKIPFKRKDALLECKFDLLTLKFQICSEFYIKHIAIIV